MDGRTKCKYRAAHVDTIAIPESRRVNGADNAAARCRQNVICRIFFDVPNAQVTFVQIGAPSEGHKTPYKCEVNRSFRRQRCVAVSFTTFCTFVFRRANLLRRAQA